MIAMKNAVQRLNAEYRLNLTEEEIEAITQQAEAAQQLFQKLFEVNVEGVAPALKACLSRPGSALRQAA